MEQAVSTETFAQAGTIILILVGILVILAISLLPTIFYLLTLQKAFTRCRPQNRTMSPGLVWLMFIPVFGIIWHFFIVTGLSDSLEREYAARGEAVEPQPGRSIGLAMCILNACSLIPYVGAFTALAGFICWILYWVKIAGYSSRLLWAPQAARDDIPPAG